MRFLQLDLLAYGHFTNASLRFPAEGPGFHVIYGSNEAGKSTTLRAITGFLFGIEERTGDSFLHGTKGLKIGARLQHSSGAVRSFLRKKGRSGTLLDGEGQPLDEDQLRAWLSVTDRKQFEVMFGLSHEQLRAAGDALADAGTAAGEKLFSAALSGTSLQKTLTRFETEAAKLFVEGGYSSAFSRSLAGYKEKIEDTKKYLLLSKRWDDLQTEFEKAAADEQEKSKAVAAASVEVQKLKRLQTALPHLRRRSEAMAERQALGQFRLLPPEIPSECRELRRRCSEAYLRISQLDERMMEIERECATLAVPQDLLEASPRIEQLAQDLGKLKSELEAKPRVTQEIVTHKNQELEYLRELGLPHLHLDGLESIRVDEASIRHIVTLDKEGGILHEQLRQTKDSLRKKQAVAQELRRQLADRPPPPDARVLKVALQQTPDRKLDTKLSEAERRLAESEQQVREAVLAMERWQGPPEAALTIVAPMEETIRGYVDEELQEVKDRKQLSKQREDLTEELERLERELQKCLKGGALPSERELRAARKHRSEGWQLVLRAWEKKTSPSTVNDDYASSVPLAEAYAAAVDNADQVADQLRQEADRVAKYEQLKEKLSDTKGRLQENAREQEQLENRSAERRNRWARLWTDFSFEAASPRDMLGWRKRFEELRQCLRERDEARRAAEELRHTLSEQQRILESVLQTANVAVPAGLPWRNLLLLAEQLHEDAQARTQADEAQRKDLARLQQEIASLEGQDAEQERAVAEWRKNWGVAVAQLRLGPDARGEAAQAVIDKLRQLFSTEEKRQRQEFRLKAIDRQIKSFDSDVTALAQRFLPELNGSSIELAEALIRRHTEAQKMAERRKTRHEELERQGVELSEARRHHDAADARFKALLRSAECSTIEELEQAERRSEQARECDERLRQAEAMLNELAGAEPISQLEELAKAVTADALATQVAEWEQRFQILKSDHEESLKKLGAARERRNEPTGGDQYALAMAEAQEQLATARAHAERYARLRIASVLLRRAVDNYRKNNEGHILRRAGELFRQLTSGRYEQLCVAYEGEKAKLKCVRNGEEVDVVTGALSDGTLDQLFLSLRLASIEQHLNSQEPMPLVLDDIFIHFDDQRAQAGIEVLADVAKKTQIILLTHHARNLELARRALSASAWMEHRLGASSQQPEPQVA